MNARNEMNMTFAEAPEDAVVRLYRTILNEITIEPEKIEIDKNAFGFGTSEITVKADRTDFSKVLGQGQAQLRALKTIAKIASDRGDKNITVALQEINEGEKKWFDEDWATASDDWDRDRVRGVLQEVFDFLMEYPCAVVITDQNRASEVAVIASSSEREATCRWLEKNLEPTIKAIGNKQKRRMSFRIIRDDMLLLQQRRLEV